MKAKQVLTLQNLDLMLGTEAAKHPGQKPHKVEGLPAFRQTGFRLDQTKRTFVFQ